MKLSLLGIVFFLLIVGSAQAEHKCFGPMAVVEVRYQMEFNEAFDGYFLIADHIFHRCGIGGQISYSFFAGLDSALLYSDLPATEEEQYGTRTRYHVVAPGDEYLSAWRFKLWDGRLTISEFEGLQVLDFPMFNADDKHKDVVLELTVSKDKVRPVIWDHAEKRLLTDEETAAFVEETATGYLVRKPLGLIHVIKLAVLDHQ
ncbi:MAG: hypothetical protein A2284_01375 [Deltaproteobacteria bacterium RIFOXYA12_FULL_61_11]|nr:MAG: hypothetical protein A2284_01375 [Deltaproteobacteria bacterium RIFOXYA12_FULL_61_11]